jgi:hypothetical protein
MCDGGGRCLHLRRSVSAAREGADRFWGRWPVSMGWVREVLDRQLRITAPAFDGNEGI